MKRYVAWALAVCLAWHLSPVTPLGAAENSPRGAGGESKPATILVLGDSLTAGYGLSEANAFPSQLERALQKAGHPVRVLNGGVSGDTSAGGRARVVWALGDKPDLLVVELGANDGLRGIDPRATEANLEAIILEAKQRGVMVLLTGMLAPPNLGKEYGGEFNAVFPRLAERHGVAFYPFFLEGVAAQPHLNQSDGIHPNARGVAVIVEGILPAIKNLLPGETSGKSGQAPSAHPGKRNTP